MAFLGEEYLLEELLDECGNTIEKTNKTITKDQIYWIGYIYRYWHYYKNENSKNIYKQAPYETMRINYLMFHTTNPELAIDDLLEIHEQNKIRRKK